MTRFDSELEPYPVFAEPGDPVEPQETAEDYESEE